MAVFLEVKKPEDRNLLHATVRDSDEIEIVVDNVEDEIIDFYSQRPSIPLRFRTGRENLYTTSDISVRLIGYNKDDPANSDTQLVSALKKTIAKVSSYILMNYDNSNNIGSIQQGDRSITYAGKAPTWDEFPPGWQRLLKNFDDREAVYSI